MTESSTPRIVRWPFLAADVVLLGLAAYLVDQAVRPMDIATMGYVVICVLAGAWLATSPWRLEYKAMTKLSEADRLLDAMEQISNLEEVGEKISGATGQWLAVQERADKTASAAKEIADRMNLEAEEFRSFLERANETEKNHLRLEVEKLRRAEGDWIEVIVRIMDNVFGLHAAAVRSGQPKLAEQIGAFQHVCRDTCRRVGLVPFAATPEQAFDPSLHRSADQDQQPPAGAVILETLAAGFTFQGQLVRRALVRLEEPKTDEPGTPAAEESEESSRPATEADPIGSEKQPATSPESSSPAAEDQASLFH
jgi:molecular chaperone GrpE (heat shock protein)